MGWNSWLQGNDGGTRRRTQALDASTCSIMIADRDRNIVYANKAVKDLLKSLEPQIKEELPHFNADNIVGQNIDQFHKNPSHQRNVLSGLSSQMVSAIQVGDIYFKLTLSPLYSKSNKNIGTMVEWVDQSELLVNGGMITALHRSQAIAEYSLEGEVINANDNFLKLTGFTLKEITDQPHSRLFVDKETAQSVDYKNMWDKLRRGEVISGTFKRINKQQQDIWVRGSYNPIFDQAGKVTKFVEFSTDVTEERRHSAYYEGQIEAIKSSQAVIEFDMDGTILDANDIFLNAMGYTLDEVKGKHHRIFVDTQYSSSAEYASFWQKLSRGEFETGEFKRIGKGGREVWINATYTPIKDQNGIPFRVVKFASDITARTEAINDVKMVMRNLTQGNLTTRMKESNDEDFQELTESINHFIEELNETIARIKVGCESINDSSSEIARGNADLSNRTEQQAANLEETASSMEQMTSTVQLNAENAKQANSLALESSSVAGEGGKLIAQAVDTMGSINESAKKIEDIIGVIDGIAFQTNILALNAAVEAARAGEQGRGFAVVATEVRTLAQRSANAAKDIKELISDSVSKIENGNSLVTRSGETMENIVTSIKRVNDIMSEIAAASEEQANGIDEINRAVTQMDEMTQQNAALVEEAAAASEGMSNQASQLLSRVSHFDTDDVDVSDMATAAKPAKYSAPTVRSGQVARTQVKASPKTKADDDDEWESF